MHNQRVARTHLLLISWRVFLLLLERQSVPLSLPSVKHCLKVAQVPIHIIGKLLKICLSRILDSDVNVVVSHVVIACTPEFLSQFEIITELQCETKVILTSLFVFECRYVGKQVMSSRPPSKMRECA